MSHNIFENDKQQGIEMAWHGLTEVHPEGLSLSDNWLTAWDGSPVKLVADNEEKTNTGFSLLMATDKPGLLIGKPFNPETYKPVYNREFVDIARKLCDRFPGAKPISIGSLRNRRRVFIALQLPEGNGGEYKAGGRDFRGLFNLLNSFDQSCPVMGVGSNICTVCDNTFSANMAAGFGDEEASGAIARHTLGLDLKALADGMTEAIKYQLGFANQFDAICAKPIDKDNAVFAFAGFVGEKRAQLTSRSAGIVDSLTALFLKGAGSNGDDLGDWFSAITDFYTHQNAGVVNPKHNEEEQNASKLKQWMSSEYGSGAKAKSAAWDIVNDESRMAKLIASGRDLWTAWQKGQK